MIRALFFDLDGTLLNSKKCVDDTSVRAIGKARGRGVKVYFASARSPRLDQTLLWTDREFSLFDGGIYCNGACAFIDGETTYTFMDADVVRDIIAIVSKFKNVHLSLHMPDEGYAFNFAPDAGMDHTWGLKNARIMPISDRAVRSTTKILVFYDHLTDAKDALPNSLIDAFRRTIGNRARFYVTDQGKTVQFAARDVSKLSAVKRVQESMNLNNEEICVFGDDVNDLEMISYYKHSVAMGNGADAVKEKAGFITKSNDENGIAFAIDNYILNGEDDQ
ncbi:MAG: HAD family hydrolase [Clostridia bacterium]|nr:HAD family hydrolase [Clostridia bacterium]